MINREERQSFAHFLTSTCAIVGGVLTVAGLIDSFVVSVCAPPRHESWELTVSSPCIQYAGRSRLKTGGVKTGLGFAAREGKFL